MCAFPVRTFEDPHLAELSQILEFSPDALARNCQGYLSVCQAKHLEQQLGWPLLKAIKAAIGIIILFIILTIVTWPGGFICLFLVIGTSCVILFLDTERKRITNNLAERRVWDSTICLSNSSKITGLGNFKTYLTADSGERMRVPYGLFNRLHVGQVYRVYFIHLNENSIGYGIYRKVYSVLVSIEPTTKWVEKSKNKRKK